MSRRARVGRYLLTLTLALVGLSACGGHHHDVVAPDPSEDGGSSDVFAEGATGDAEGGLLDAEVVDVTAADDASGSIGASCLTFASGYCGELFRCGAVTAQLEFGTVANCEQRIAKFCPLEFSASGTSVTPDNRARCGHELAMQTCGEALTVTPPDCAVPGALPIGAGCEFSSQCQSTFCLRAAYSFCGTCQRLSTLSQGCDPSQIQCDNGLLCADAVMAPSRQWICTKLVADGGACVTPAQCDPSQTCSNGTCITLDEAGAACETACSTNASLDCLPGVDGGFACTPVTVVDAGEACDPSTGIFCGDLGQCIGWSGRTTPGACSPIASDGNPCGGDTSCMPPALCIDGICQGAVPASSCGAAPDSGVGHP